MHKVRYLKFANLNGIKNYTCNALADITKSDIKHSRSEQALTIKESGKLHDSCFNSCSKWKFLTKSLEKFIATYTNSREGSY